MAPKKRSSLAAVGAGIANSSGSISRPASSCSPKPYDSINQCARSTSNNVCGTNSIEDIVEVAGVAWSKCVPVPRECQEQGVVVAQTELRGTSLEQIRTLGSLILQISGTAGIYESNTKRVPHELVNMYHVVENIIIPLTARFCCSWVELVAVGPQPPTWFVSHWWGTPFRQTTALLKFHSSQRASLNDSMYWICTFANNQHDLSELGGSLQVTPFVKAILSDQCKGTLTLLDNSVTTFERIWCVLENFVSTTWTTSKSSPHLLDFAAYLPAGSATFGGNPVPEKATLRKDLGNGKWKEEIDDEASGGAFPLTVSAKGSSIDIFKAKSSRQEDRLHILHLIAGTPEDSWGTIDPPETCDAYDNLNSSARRVFAAGAMYAAAIRSDIKGLAGLIQAFPDAVNECISDGATCVYAAAWKNNIPELQMLLRAKGSPNSQKDDGATPLFIAAQTGNEEAVVELMEAKADPNLTRESVTPSFMAVQKKHEGVLKVLLDAAANPDIANSHGVTPLLLASQQGYHLLVKRLLEARATGNIASDNGNTPMSIAKSPAVIKLLMEAKCNVNDKPAVEVDIFDSLTSLGSGCLAPPAPKSKAKPKAKGKHMGTGQAFAHSMGNFSTASPSHLGLIGMYEACENESAEIAPRLASRTRQARR